MEAEMKMVFQQKVQEKEAKLKQSEEELYARHREMKEALEKQRAELEDKKRRLESGRPLTPEKASVSGDLGLGLFLSCLIDFKFPFVSFSKPRRRASCVLERTPEWSAAWDLAFLCISMFFIFTPPSPFYSVLLYPRPRRISFLCYLSVCFLPLFRVMSHPLLSIPSYFLRKSPPHSLWVVPAFSFIDCFFFFYPSTSDKITNTHWRQLELWFLATIVSPNLLYASLDCGACCSSPLSYSVLLFERVGLMADCLSRALGLWAQGEPCETM